MPTPLETSALPAVVARPSIRSDEQASYLLLTPHGQATWTGDPRAATAFASMREAARAAFRLPGALRAYGLPLSVELTLARVH
jgi:hypothetical protein